MELFMPTRVFFEPGALNYPLGRELYELMAAKGIPRRITPSHNRVLGIPGDTPQIAYREAKRTLVVGSKNHLNWTPAVLPPIMNLPSGPVVRGLSVLLSRHAGTQPYIRIYVNVDEILAAVDPTSTRTNRQLPVLKPPAPRILAVEHLTGSLRKPLPFRSPKVWPAPSR